MPRREFELENNQEAVSDAQKRRKMGYGNAGIPVANTPGPGLANNDYTIGWICAIRTEYVAAQAFLDEQHEGPEYVSRHDNNDYTLGKIGKHNVVIAVLPYGEYGISCATGVARDMLHSFPNVRIGLMVGIGGGAPSRKHDIRLGDIVVSASSDGKGGVFQYDFGKTMQDQAFQHTRFLDQPPMVLRTAINGLMARYETDGHRLKEAINNILEKKPRLQQKYKQPDPSSDRLYQSAVIHPLNDEANCAAVCSDDQLNLILRPERTDNEDNPAIHYGLIASANQLMKNALARDTLAAEKDILCFEMEAAGLMNHFPCLVIRGICDYSDSHKNKEWQGYAAMAAAAYAKDLLYRIAPNKVESERRISEVLSSVKEGVNALFVMNQDTNSAVKHLGNEQRRGKIEHWLSSPDASINYNKALQQRHKSSGLWFIQSNAFAKWKKRRNSFLWLYGIPGCGKTILSSAIIENLDSTPSSQPLLYFYFDFNDTGKQTLESMARSFVSQLSCQREDTWEQLDSLFSSCKDGREQPSPGSLYKVLLHMIEQVKEAWIVLDALDECRTRRGPPTEGLLSWLRDLLKSDQINVHLLVTSRQEQDVESEARKLGSNDDIIPIQGDSITDDIRAYVRTRVREDEGLKRWRTRPDVQEEIEARLIERTNGMFRWAQCQLDALADCLDYDELKDALTSLPETLYETYSRILRGIPSRYKEKATRILQFLVFSERPLRIEEAVDVIAVKPTGVPYFDPNARLPDPQEISRYCSSLVVVVPLKGRSYNKDSKYAELQIAHFSVKEYLTSNRLDEDIAQNFREVVAKALIATVCLAYLLQLDVDLPTKEIRKTFPLAQYCARYWMTNAIVAESKDEALQDTIRQFFCYHRNSYRNCYSLYRPDLPWDDEPARAGNGPASALYYASFGGLGNAVKYLLSQGTDVNAQGGEYGNALQAASYRGHEQVVKLLLDRGTDINARGRNYGNALQAASDGGYEQVVKLLLDRGADVNARGGYYGNALQAASDRGYEQVVKLLLDGAADVNAQGGHYGNALQAASFGGHEQVVKKLLDEGADVNAQSGHYGNALQAASFGGHEQVVKLLLDKGATREQTWSIDESISAH